MHCCDPRLPAAGTPLAGVACHCNAHSKLTLDK